MKKTVSLICALALCASMSACTVESVVPPAPLPSDYPETVISGTERQVPDVRIYLDGLLTAGGIAENGNYYIPLRVILDYLCLEAEYSLDGETLSVTAPGFSLIEKPGDRYLEANNRYFYTPEGFVFRDGEAYLPPEAVEWLFGVICTEGEGTVDIDTTTAAVLKGGENYYESRYSFEDVYWLNHVIYAEAMNEPLEGLIAVGNVILNRVKHPLFPSNIYDVVFDTKYQIQFESSLNNAMGDDTDEISLLAAYMCLEGCNTAGNSIFFINPEKGSDAWLKELEQYVVTYGKHDFYSEKES